MLLDILIVGVPKILKTITFPIVILFTYLFLLFLKKNFINSANGFRIVCIVWSQPRDYFGCAHAHKQDLNNPPWFMFKKTKCWHTGAQRDWTITAGSRSDTQSVAVSDEEHVFYFRTIQEQQHPTPSKCR